MCEPPSATTHPIYEFFRARYQERTEDFPWSLDGKLEGKAFAESAGIPVPRTLQMIDSLAMLEQLQLWKRCFVKPSDMHSAKGTFALVRLSSSGLIGSGSGVFQNLLWPRRTVSREDVITCHRSAWREFSEHNRRIPHAVIVEDLVRSPLGEFAIPLDVKFYFVAGEIRFVVVINRNCPGGARYGFWDRNMQPTHGLLRSCRVRVTDEAPARRNWVALVDAATALGERLETPFASIDLYDSDDGPVFGEFTPAPGGAFAWALGKQGFWEFDEGLLDHWWSLIAAAH